MTSILDKAHTPFNLARDAMDRNIGEEGRSAILWNSHARAIYNVAVRQLALLQPFPSHLFAGQYASIHDMQRWAESVMRRDPDFVIGGDYMRRWYIIPRNETFNLYLHETLRSDEDVMHDHPWDNTSFVISGGYIEHMPGDISVVRAPGETVSRKATDAHRLELIGGQPSISLFFTGPKIRDWGFHCPKGWVSWQDFTGGYHSGRSDKGAGCGEMA